MPLDWSRLRIFHAAAEAGSFTHAAETLYLSQSAISRQVSALEREIGVPLFQRHARGLILTEQGELLYRTAHEIFLKLEDVREQLSESTDEPKGTLRVSTSVGLGANWLTDRLPEFLETYPEIRLQLILSNEELDLMTRQADCAIRLRQPSHPDLIQRKLFTVRLRLFASPAYLDKFGRPQSIKDLDHHRIITFGQMVPQWLGRLNQLETLGKSHGTRRQASLQINDLRSIRRSAEKGAGIAILPDYMITEEVPLEHVLPEYAPEPFDTYFCYPQAMKGQAKLVVFRDFLLNKARSWNF